MRLSMTHHFIFYYVCLWTIIIFSYWLLSSRSMRLEWLPFLRRSHPHWTRWEAIPPRRHTAFSSNSSVWFDVFRMDCDCLVSNVDPTQTNGSALVTRNSALENVSILQYLYIKDCRSLRHETCVHCDTKKKIAIHLPRNVMLKNGKKKTVSS